MVGFLRYILFCVFFAAGMGAVSFSLLVGEIDEYYRNADALEISEAENTRLEKLDAEYDLQLKQIEHDPNVVARLKRLTIGTEPTAEDTAYPTASTEDLEMAKSVLSDNGVKPKSNDPLRNVVRRCINKRIRLSLFIAGAGLTTITLIFFSKSKSQTEE